MIDLIGQVLRVQQQTGQKPIIVHCRWEITLCAGVKIVCVRNECVKRLLKSFSPRVVAQYSASVLDSQSLCRVLARQKLVILFSPPNCQPV